MTFVSEIEAVITRNGNRAIALIPSPSEILSVHILGLSPLLLASYTRVSPDFVPESRFKQVFARDNGVAPCPRRHTNGALGDRLNRTHATTRLRPSESAPPRYQKRLQKDLGGKPNKTPSKSRRG